MAIKSNKNVFWINFVLKSAFAAILLFFLYRQVFKSNDLTKSWDHFILNLEEGHLIYLIICVLMMPINWGLESQKWKLLVEPFEKISFYKSFQAIFSGISVALLTPNRIGEYGGRMVMVEAKNNWKAVISTLMSSYSQNIWNIGIGLVAAILFIKLSSGMETYLFISAIVMSLVFLFVILLLYYNIDLLNKIISKLSKVNFIKKSLVHLKLLEEYKNKLLTKVLLLAFLRYFIYLLQYYLILRFFGLEVTYVNALLGISTIFLVQTSLPLPPIIGFLARGEIALLVWESYNFNELSILASSYLLWFLNLIIPSMVGAVIILTSNLSRTFGLNRNYFK